jgi:Protein of unknown function (DUF2950)
MTTRHVSARRLATTALVVVLAAPTIGCSWMPGRAAQRTFSSPEDAARALIEAARGGKLDELMTLFGPEAQPLVDAADPRAAQLRRQVFVVAAREGWRLVSDGGDRRTLEVGHESWPFPVPIVRDGDSWKFDTAAGIEEIVVRRIGRNELAAIRVCRAYVLAQLLYAQQGHDGKPAGLYATAIRSDPGKHNGLYWPAARGEKRSPLGDLLADAADQGKSPFHGYHFKVVRSPKIDGFALVAWPAQYDATGVMTFVVSEDGVVRERDLGPETVQASGAMTSYNPDDLWDAVK